MIKLSETLILGESCIVTDHNISSPFINIRYIATKMVPLYSAYQAPPYESSFNLLAPGSTELVYLSKFVILELTSAAYNIGQYQNK